ALLGALKKIDKNGDGRLDASEIADRLTSFQQSGVQVLAVTCRVVLNGAPVTGATVRLIPEKFLGDGIKPASGVTDSSGAVSLNAEGLPGVYCGFYRIEVSKKDPGGTETVPARYNTQTVLGQEVAPDMRGGI